MRKQRPTGMSRAQVLEWFTAYARKTPKGCLLIPKDTPGVGWAGKGGAWYPCISFEGSKVYLARLAIEEALGYPLRGGPHHIRERAVHICGEHTCINPDHIKVGTQLDAVRNRDRLGRNGAWRNAGERNYNSVLTDSIVREARRAFARGVSCAELSRKYNVGEATMHRAIRKVSWRHVA